MILNEKLPRDFSAFLTKDDYERGKAAKEIHERRAYRCQATSRCVPARIGGLRRILLPFLTPMSTLKIFGRWLQGTS
jgi:hypothetical protein